MHDTPAHNLFEKTNRSFSHGCIRLSEPEKLAEFLLVNSEAGWTSERIREVIDSKKRKIAKLHEPVPVHLVYQTAWVDGNGALHFNNDLYGRDRQLVKALFAE